MPPPQQAFKRYPDLEKRFNSVVINFFKRSMEPTTKLVSNMVACVPYLSFVSLRIMLMTACRMQACYINTTHPDFLNGHKVNAFRLYSNPTW